MKSNLQGAGLPKKSSLSMIFENSEHKRNEPEQEKSNRSSLDRPAPHLDLSHLFAENNEATKKKRDVSLDQQESYCFEFSSISPSDIKEEDSVDKKEHETETADETITVDFLKISGINVVAVLLTIASLSPFVYFYSRIFHKGGTHEACMEAHWLNSSSIVMDTLFQHCDCVPVWMEAPAYFDPTITLYLALFLIVAFSLIRRIKNLLFVCWRWCWVSGPVLLTSLHRYHALPESNRVTIQSALRRKFPSMPQIELKGPLKGDIRSKPCKEWFKWFSGANEQGELLVDLVSKMSKFPSSPPEFWRSLEAEWRHTHDMPDMFQDTQSNKEEGSSEMEKLAGLEFCAWLKEGEGAVEDIEAVLLDLIIENERKVREDAEQTDMTVFFALQLLLGVGVLIDYVALQTWPSGGLLCRWVYFSSVVMYKPFTAPMCFCLTACVHYAFSDQLFGDLHRDPSTGTPLGAPLRRSRLTLLLVSGVAVLQLMWLIPALPVVLPLMLIFLPVVALPAVVLPLVCGRLLQKALDGVGLSVSLQFRYFALKLVASDGMKLGTLARRLRADRTVVLTAVKNDGKSLRYALGRLKEDKELLMLAMGSGNASILEFAPKELLSDFDFVFKAVSVDGLALRYASDELKHDVEIVTMAVIQNGLAIQYAPDSMRDKRSIALYAVEQCGLSLEFVSDRLKYDEEIVRAAVDQDPNAQKFATLLSTHSKLDSLFKHDSFAPSLDTVLTEMEEEARGVNIETFSEAIVMVQASATVLVSVVVLSFIFLPFYEKGFGFWTHGTSRFLTANYHLPSLLEQSENFFSWPDFEQQKLNIQFALGLMLLAVFAVMRCSKWLLAAVEVPIKSSTPGVWERTLMATFSNMTWRPLREPVEILSTLLEQCMSMITAVKEHDSHCCSLGYHMCWSRVKVFRAGTNDADVIEFTDSDDATSYKQVQFDRGNHASLKALGVVSMRCPWISISSVSFDNIRGDLHNFCTIKTLVHLDLSHCAHLTGDLLSIRTLRLLTHLDLSYCPHVDGELSSIAGLTLLSHVNLGHCEQITGDIGDLATLTALRYIHLTGSSKVTVLWKGLEHNHTAVLKLLSAGVYQNCIPADGFSPLHGAATSGYADILAAIVDVQGGFVNSTELLNQHTALHCAALNGRQSAISCLTERGADVALADKDGMTALHFATRGGYNEIASLLIEAGADVRAVNRDRATPLHLAALGGHGDCVLVMLDNRADPAAVDAKQWTGLHYACRHGHTSAAKHFLPKVDVNYADKRKWTPLHLAARYGHHITAAMLVEEGADIHCMSINGSSPLHFAAASGHLSTVAKLIALGADRDVFDKQKWTPAHHAAFNKHDVIVALLHEASSSKPYVDIQEDIKSRPRPTLETNASVMDMRPSSRSQGRPMGRQASGLNSLRSKSTPRPLIGREQSNEGTRAASVNRAGSRPELTKEPSGLKMVRPAMTKNRSQLSFSKVPGNIRNHSKAYAGYGAAI